MLNASDAHLIYAVKETPQVKINGNADDPAIWINKTNIEDSIVFGTDKYNGIFDCAKKTYKQGGFKAFMRGINYTVIRAAPTAAVVLPSYEVAKDYLDNNRVW